LKAPANILRTIYEHREKTLVRNRARDPMENLVRRALAQRGARRSLLNALRNAHGVGIIGELKYASPSRGAIIGHHDPAAIAKRLEAAGVDALSIVTEENFFGGDLSNLRKAREATRLPLLRKDFLTSEYEVVQSAAYGADAILLIVAGLTDEQTGMLCEEAARYCLDVVLEVHDEQELQRALPLKPAIIGINNRDLRTFEVSISISADILPLIPLPVFAISESGLTSPAKVRQVVGLGAGGCLIGESLLRTEDPGAFVTACRPVLVR